MLVNKRIKFRTYFEIFLGPKGYLDIIFKKFYLTNRNYNFFQELVAIWILQSLDYTAKYFELCFQKLHFKNETNSFLWEREQIYQRPACISASQAVYLRYLK